MSSRFGRDPRAGLFSAYDAQQRPKSQSASPSPYRPNSYSYSYTATAERQFHSSSNPAFGAYPDSANGGPSSNSFRPATLNKKGQYSDAVLNELESQNEAQLEGMSAKVRMLKDITVTIGDEIRDSTALAEKMSNTFEGTRVRLRGTMNRMLRMAERTGVGWRVWMMFFAAVILLFWWVRR